jgi:hypothetical protein
MQLPTCMLPDGEHVMAFLDESHKTAMLSKAAQKAAAGGGQDLLTTLLSIGDQVR